MIGSPELEVTGITADGERVPGPARRRLADLALVAVAAHLGPETEYHPAA